jgi:hypothetical protein
MELRKVTKDECVKALQLYSYTQQYDITSRMYNDELLAIVAYYWFKLDCRVDLLDKLHVTYEINSEIINKSEKEANGNQI